MNKDQMVALAKQFAVAHGLDPAIVCAVCEQESGWNPWINRYEPAFETNPRYNANIQAGAQIFAHTVNYTVTLATEIKNRCMSWGLMQTLGQTAREFGAKCPLPNLADPAYGLEWGVTILKHKIAVVAKGDVTAGLLAWNGGGNPDYAAEVQSRMGSYRNA
jgi:soluble lytic murein transglycosylase-like protein